MLKTLEKQRNTFVPVLSMGRVVLLLVLCLFTLCSCVMEGAGEKTQLVIRVQLEAWLLWLIAGCGVLAVILSIVILLKQRNYRPNDLIDSSETSPSEQVPSETAEIHAPPVSETPASRKLAEPPAEAKPAEQLPFVASANSSLSAPLDEQFMEKLTAYIEEHLSDTDLNINQMASEMYLGRTVFYRKVKEKTGQTPNDYLQTYRLSRAGELLDSGLYNVSQVCFMVGFSTPSHFSTSFKRFYGVSPRRYLMNLAKEKKKKT